MKTTTSHPRSATALPWSSWPLLLLLLAAAAPLAATAADGAATRRVEITAPRADVAAARVVRERRDGEAAYRLSTGRVLQLAFQGDEVVLRHRPVPTLLRHDGAGGFVSADGRVALRFELDDAGEPSRLRMSLPASAL